MPSQLLALPASLTPLAVPGDPGVAPFLQFIPVVPFAIIRPYRFVFAQDYVFRTTRQPRRSRDATWASGALIVTKIGFEREASRIHAN